MPLFIQRHFLLLKETYKVCRAAGGAAYLIGLAALLTAAD
jgi:hypothetical protein